MIKIYKSKQFYVYWHIFISLESGHWDLSKESGSFVFAKPFT